MAGITSSQKVNRPPVSAAPALIAGMLPGWLRAWPAPSTYGAARWSIRTPLTGVKHEPRRYT